MTFLVRPQRQRRLAEQGLVVKSAAGDIVRKVQLETHRALSEAISMYRRAGYREVPAFNDERYAHHWFEKDLDR